MDKKETEKFPINLTKEWIAQTAEDARQIGYIAVDNLCWHFGYEEKYNTLLPTLWKKYECDKRGPKEPKITTAQERVVAWLHLFERLAFGRVAGITSEFKNEIEFPLYFYNTKNRRYEKYDREIDDDIVYYVKLTDLNDIFSNIIKIPLPLLLFPKHEPETTKEPEDDQAAAGLAQKKTGKAISQEVSKLIRDAKPEIESIYKTVKDGEGFSKQGVKANQARQQDAKNFFEENNGTFKVLKEEHLESIEPFEITNQQTGRKIKGGLLKIIVKEFGHGSLSATKLYEEYQKI